MEDKKSKKKTLTLSTTLTKKIDISSLNKDGKKSYSIEKKNPSKAQEVLKKQIPVHFLPQEQIIKKHSQENLLNNKQLKLL